MPDIIRLLPDKIANRIAAGEVVLRPASVVKELLENSVDAGATRIKLIVRNAGKKLIQVIDDGKGMSETDARMSFERHATSKIQKIDDLFEIKTKGFRGEALASIASVAKVELQTKLKNNSAGTKIIVEGSDLKTIEPCACNNGTMMSVHNLFYNTPARQKFLKSEPVELRHIIDEFIRVCIAHENIFFSLVNNENEIYHLPASNKKQRIINVFGKNISEKLIELDEETELVSFSGFVGTPDSAKKRRGDQFFFVNNRFIKSPYLNHAVKTAYDLLIPKESHPFYTIFLTLQPEKVDINVHPSKHEVKFEDERIIYNYLQVAVKHALGASNAVPSIDFTTPSIGSEKIKDNYEYQPTIETGRDKNNRNEWEKLYSFDDLKPIDKNQEFLFNPEKSQHSSFSISGQVFCIKSDNKIYFLHKRNSLEKIFFTKLMHGIENNSIPKQKEIFPQTIQLSPADAALLPSILDDINALGFELQDFGDNSFINYSTPAIGSELSDLQTLVSSLLEDFRKNRPKTEDRHKRLASKLAKELATNDRKQYNSAEVDALFRQITDFKDGFYTANGKKCLIEKNLEELKSWF